MDEPRFSIGDHECKPLMFTINMTGPDGPERKIYVAPEHPNLYRLAQEAEAKGDRQLMRAIADAAKRGGAENA